jgi:hypothetical protein
MKDTIATTLGGPEMCGTPAITDLGWLARRFGHHFVSITGSFILGACHQVTPQTRA